MLSGNVLGVDYHTKMIQLCVMSESGKVLGNKRFSNNVSELITYGRSFGEVRGGAVEVSCGSAALVDELRSKTSWDMQLCHPGYVNRMKNNPDKSDKKDSELLADLYRVGYLPKVWLAPKNLQDLRQLVRYRTQEAKRRKQLKLRILSMLRQFRIQKPPKFNLSTLWSRKWLKNNLSLLPEQSLWIIKRHVRALEVVDEEIREIEKRLLLWVKEDKLSKWLMKISNVGLVTATLLRAEIGTATRFSTGKQFSRFLALTPRNSSSGEKQVESGLIKAGNPALKKALIQVAHLLRNRDARWKAFSSRLERKGKKVNVAVAAIANRWSRVLYYKMLRFELENRASILKDIENVRKSPRGIANILAENR